jgi:hypothetical protein
MTMAIYYANGPAGPAATAVIIFFFLQQLSVIKNIRFYFQTPFLLLLLISPNDKE